MSETASTVLVVEDDEALRQLIEEELTAAGHRVVAADSGEAALRELERAEIDVVVSDVVMPGIRGDELLLEIRRREPEVPVVLITAFGSVDDAVAAMKAGAYHYVAKPVSMGQLRITVANAARERHLRRELHRLRQQVREDRAMPVAASPEMRKLVALLHRTAPVDTPILLRGESGTGKELLARLLHDASPRSAARFVAVNCSAIPATLLESQLFGHRRGAFTDAREDRRGLFQEADGGTILLDEIGDMPLELQGKILRVLQEREVHPLGAPAPIRVDVRVVAATHRDLEAMVRDGRFRNDLYYRLNVIAVRIPPLRERREDLVPLVAHFLERHGRRLGRRGVTLSAEALEAMRGYAWPGNVRELENAVERALVLGAEDVIVIGDLPEALRARPGAEGGDGSWRTLAELEGEHILRTLRAVKGNKAAAARLLGLDRRTLYRKLEAMRSGSA